MNSCENGKRGERGWRDELVAHGYDARRGQQFSGSPDSPDVVCPQLSGFHFEVKAVERLTVNEAMAQAVEDAGDKTPAIPQFDTSMS
jgi:Holliday junction resolvase